MGAALLYFATLDNGLARTELLGGDLITHQYAQVQARPSNAPGYPLFTMGGWAWFHGVRTLVSLAGIQYPNPLPILSSFSTLWALLSLWLLYSIICILTESPRKPAGNWPVALLVAAYYAVTYFFWYYATTTEQYSSAIAHTLGLLLLFILWSRHRDSLPLLFALAFLSGVSLAHMLTVAFIIPPIVAAVLWSSPSLLRKPKAILGSIVAAALPLVSYVFLYVRGGRHPEWWGSQHYATGAQWFWSFVSTAQGREELLWAFEEGRPLFGNGFPSLIQQELSIAVIVAGIIGIAYLRRPLPFVLYVTLGVYVAFSWVYRFGNWFQVILPAYSLVMIGVGSSTDRWQGWIDSRPNARSDEASGLLRYRLAHGLPILLLLAAIVLRFDQSAVRADSRNRPGDDALVRPAALLSADLPESSVVFASLDDALGMQYLTSIWGFRPDVRVVSSAVAGEVLASQPVFATWESAPTLSAEVPALKDLQIVPLSPDWVTFRLESHEPIDPRPSPSETRTVALDRQILDNVWLSGYTAKPGPAGMIGAPERDLVIDLTLQWRLANGRWPDGLSISVRPTIDGAFLRDPSGADGIVQTDRSAPAELLMDPRWSQRANLAVDPYRLRYSDVGDRQDLGAAVILYRVAEGGFEDVARLDFPIPGIQGTPMPTP